MASAMGFQEEKGKTMPWKSPEFWNFLPFVLSVGQGPTKWNVARFLEALIIAGGSILGTMYLNQQLLKSEMDHMRKDLAVVQERMKEDVGEAKDEIRELRALLFHQSKSRIGGITP